MRRKGYVYVMRHHSGAYKIGASTDPLRRAHTLRAKYGPIAIVATFPSDDYMHAEAAVQDIFQHNRIPTTREWFILDGEELLWLTELFARETNKYKELHNEYSNHERDLGQQEVEGIATVADACSG